MSNEQLDAVKDQLLLQGSAELRQSVFSAYLEEAERGANMIIVFTSEPRSQVRCNSKQSC